MPTLLTIRKRLVGWSLAAAMIATTGSTALAQQKRGAEEPPRVQIDPEEASQRLAELSAAFREVAKVARPSVVQISAESRRRRGALGERGFDGGQMDPEEFFRRFFGEEFRGAPFDPRSPGRDGQEDEEPRSPRSRRPRGFEQYDLPQRIGEASGWIYDKDGHVVTNNHVVEDADTIVVRFLDESEAKATLVGSDPNTDIAVLKVEKKGLTPAKLAREAVEPGDIVLAIGAPFEYAFSVSQGIVSATNRRVGILGPGGYESFIQTDAAINPGNSGGPLVNVRGNVVGMSTAIATRSGSFSGIGFAIPADMIQDVVEQLIRTGKVQRGYLGAFISDDRELLESFGAKNGVLVEDVIAGSPAEKAGLKGGDVILQIEGREVQSAAELRRAIAATPPGTGIRVQALRDGKKTTFNVELVELPQGGIMGGQDAREDQREEPEEEPKKEVGEALQKLGLEQLRTMTPQFADQQDMEFSKGVVVLEVRPRSVAAAEGISEGDIITQVSGQGISDLEGLNSAMDKADLKRGVRLRIRTAEGIARFVLLRLNE